MDKMELRMMDEKEVTVIASEVFIVLLPIMSQGAITKLVPDLCQAILRGARKYEAWEKEEYMKLFTHRGEAVKTGYTTFGPLTEALKRIVELEAQLDDALLEIRRLVTKLNAVKEIGDEQDRVEAENALLRKALTTVLSAAPFEGDLRILMISLKSSGLSNEDDAYATRYGMALDAAKAALARIPEAGK